MDNIVKIRILGTEFKVYTEEGEEHAKRIAAAVDAKTREIMGEDQYAPSTRVALIAAMDFCESEIKYHRIATKLKKRLEKATEELDKLSKGAGDGDYIEEITSLEEKLAAAEKTVKAKEDEISLLKEDLASLEEYRRDLAANRIAASELGRTVEHYAQKLGEKRKDEKASGALFNAMLRGKL